MSFTFPEGMHFEFLRPSYWNAVTDMTVLKGIMNDAKIYPDHLPPVIFDPFLAICASFRQRAQNAPK